jgi:hypothetical protein
LRSIDGRVWQRTGLRSLPLPDVHADDSGNRRRGHGRNEAPRGGGARGFARSIAQRIERLVDAPYGSSDFVANELGILHGPMPPAYAF